MTSDSRGILALSSRDELLVGALFAIVITGCYLIYSPGLGGPFLLDDFPQLEPLFQLNSSNWQEWVGHFIYSRSGPLHRPVAMASFMLDAVAHGNDIWYWKYTNLLLHLLTATLIFWLTARLMLAFRRSMTPSVAWWFSLLVSAIWLLHPLQVSTVLYTVQRMAQLAALFVFLGLLSYTVGRARQLSGRPYGGVFIMLAFSVCFPLAGFSKENGLLFPLFAVLLEGLFFKFQGSPKDRRLLAIFYGIFLLLPGVLALILTASSFEQWILRGYEGREFTLYQRVLTELRVITHYLYQLAIPVQRHMGFYHDDLLISEGLLHPPTTLFSLLFVVTLLTSAVLLYRRLPMFTFGIAWFFSAHLLESTIFPLELMYEHRNYLASYGFFFAAASFLVTRPGRIGLRVTLSLLILSGLGGLSTLRVDTWSSPAKMYSYMLYAHPDSKRLNVFLANAAVQAGHYGAALRMIKRFAGPGAAIHELYIYCRRDQLITEAQVDSAVRQMQGPVDDYLLSALMDLANLGLDGDCRIRHDLYLKLVESALGMKLVGGQSRQKLLLYKAHYQHLGLDNEAALNTLNAAFEANPASPIPLFLATEWLIAENKLERAKQYYAQARKSARQTGLNFSVYINRIEEKLDSAPSPSSD